MTADDVSVRAVCIVGAGPRGLSILERLTARLESSPDEPRVAIHIVDPFPCGSGNVWRRDQPHTLIMNTLASDASIFLDESVECDGPIFRGPTLYEWATTQKLDDLHLQSEVSALVPDSSPSRKLYGAYLSWAFASFSSRLARVGVSVTVHADVVVRLTAQPDGRESVEFGTGRPPLLVDVVVLCQGHLDAHLGQEEQSLLDHSKGDHWYYAPPSNPANQLLDDLAPNMELAVRGLGLNFFDVMSLVTENRGGSFTRDGDGHLNYHPTGNEPRLWVGSHRGFPFKAKAKVNSQYRAIPRRFPSRSTLAEFWERRGPGLDFLRDLWPEIYRESLYQFLSAWLRAKGVGEDDLVAVQERFVRLSDNDPDAWQGFIATELGTESPPYDPGRSGDPLSGVVFASQEDLQECLRGLICSDLEEARLGLASPVKAADQAIGNSREWVLPLVSYEGISAQSRRDHIDRWYLGFANSIAGGPPILRIEQMLALMDHGVIQHVGAGIRVVPDRRGVRVRSKSIPGFEISCQGLIDARLPAASAVKTQDQLLSTLLETGRARVFRMESDSSEEHYSTDGIEVSEAPYRLIDSEGSASESVFAWGIPLGVHIGRTLSPVARTNSEFLREADVIASAVLAGGSQATTRR